MEHHPPRVLGHLVRDRTWSVLIAFAVVTAAAGAVSTGITIDTSVESLWVVDDPDREATYAFKTEFSNDEVIIAALELGRPFQLEDLKKLAALTEAVEDIPGVQEAVSLATIADIRPGIGGGVDASALVDLVDLEENQGAFAALVERVRGHRLYSRSLVSPELDVFALTVVLDVPTADKSNISAAREAIVEVLAAEAPPWTVHLAGYSVFEAESDHRVRSDLVRLSPPTAAVVMLLIFLFTRSIFALLLVGALIVWTEAITHAFYVLTDTPLNIVTAMVPSLLMVISGTYAIYFLGLLQRVRDYPEPAVTVLGLITKPALVSGASTAIGFLALHFIDITSVRTLGYGLAVGILAAVAATLLLLPALVKVRGFRPPPLRYTWLEPLATLGVRMARRPWLVVGCATVIIAAAVPGLAQLYIDTNPLNYLPSDSPSIQANDFIEDHLAGTTVLAVVVRGEDPNAALAPEVSRFADGLTTYLSERESTGMGFSVLDIYLLVGEALRPGAPSSTVPPTLDAAAQYLLAYELGGDLRDLRHYLNHDRSAMALHWRSTDQSSASTSALVSAIGEFAARHAPASVTVKVLGSKQMFAKSVESISSGLIGGLAGTIALVFMVFLVMLRSLRVSLIAVIPNLLPVIICGAAFGFIGIPISVGTSVVGLIAIGLAVDDTSHVLAHVDRRYGLLPVYRTVGPPIIMTTIALGLGFMVVTASQFQVILVFGVATALTLVVAVLVDILLLPSLLRLIGFKLEDDDDEAAAAHEDAPRASTVAGARDLRNDGGRRT